MLIRLLGGGLLFLIAACDTETRPPETPLVLEARYRLSYNDTLVGTALFDLEIDADGSYRLSAFTVPAGQMQREGEHEVLESSRGRLFADAIHPTAFERSVMQDGKYALGSLTFDWDHRTLTAAGPNGSRVLGLPPGAHDRLSYLLAARRLAASGDGGMLIQVASLQASEETQLQVDGSESIEVPFGRFDAVSIRRIGPDADDDRRLWYAPSDLPLPLRISQVRDGNSVVMQLEDISRRSNDPR